MTFEERKAKFTEEFNALVAKYKCTVATNFYVKDLDPHTPLGADMPVEESIENPNQL